MVVGSFNEEYKSSVPPERLWKAAIVDSHILLPKIAPQFIAKIEILEGDGGAGTIKLVTFTPAVKEMTTVKTRTDVFDKENFYIKNTVLEGSNQKVESSSYDTKLEASEDGGSLCKFSAEYKTFGDYELTEEEKSKAKDGPVKTFKAIEAYLQANTEAYV